MIFIIIIFLITIYILKRYFLSTPGKEIPGPIGVPFIGNIFSIDSNNPHLSFCKLAKKYGQIFQLKMFGKKKIIVSGEEYVREVLKDKGDDFSNRSNSFRMDLLMERKSTITFGDDDLAWRKNKKFLLTAMRMYGPGLQVLEEITNEITTEFILKIQETNEQPFDIIELIKRNFMIIMTSLLFGKKFPFDDTRLDAFRNSTNEGYDAAIETSGLLLDAFPFLYNFNIPCGTCDKLKCAVEGRKKFLIPELKECLDRYDGSDNCIVHLLYKSCLEACGSKDKVDFDTLYMIVFDFFAAGWTTTSLALYALLLILCNKPDIQYKLISEIDLTVEEEKNHIELKHLDNMPYLKNTITELLRYISHVPLFITHCAKIDTSLGCYKVKKGTDVILNMFDYNHNERYWEDPWEFKPDRFKETETEKEVDKKNFFLSFSAGRRHCPGEVLAKNRLGLVVARLLKTFKFEFGGKTISCDPRTYKFSIVLQPPSFKVIAKLRSRGKSN